MLKSGNVVTFTKPEHYNFEVAEVVAETHEEWLTQEAKPGKVHLLGDLDWQFNSPPVGMLWVFPLTNRASMGLVDMFTGRYYPGLNANNVLVNVPDKQTLLALFNVYFPQVKERLNQLENSWYEKSKKFMLKLYRKCVKVFNTVKGSK
jgi:hypothetical protein